jgi:5-methylcytosine-specific restriction enzyme subunit McrC
VKRILLEEHQPVEVGPSASREAGLTSQQLERLLTAWRATTGRDPAQAFEFGPGTVKPTNWAGSVSQGDFLVEVVPRGALALDEEGRMRLDRNIGEMLHLALGSEPLSVGAGQASSFGSRFEKAVEALCEQFAVARRKQVLRRYEMREEVLRAPRGSLRFPAQAVVAIQHPGFTASRWVELSEDTAENRFLKGVLSLSRHRVGGSLRRQVDEALIALESAGTPFAPLLEYERIDFGRLLPEYASLIELARNILEGTAAGILSGSLDGRSEVIFLPDLFQGFLERLVQDFAVGRGLVAEFERRGRRLAKWSSGPFQGIGLVEVIPDVELRKPLAQGPAAVIDAKWKRIRPDLPSLNLSAGDVHQMAAYALRLGCNRLALAYPWLGDKSPLSEPPVLVIGKGAQQVKLMVVAVPLLWDHPAEVFTAVGEQLDQLLYL